jgi:hypothetical protein
MSTRSQRAAPESCQRAFQRVLDANAAALIVDRCQFAAGSYQVDAWHGGRADVRSQIGSLGDRTVQTRLAPAAKPQTRRSLRVEVDDQH